MSLSWLSELQQLIGQSQRYLGQSQHTLQTCRFRLMLFTVLPLIAAVISAFLDHQRSFLLCPTQKWLQDPLTCTKAYGCRKLGTDRDSLGQAIPAEAGAFSWNQLAGLQGPSAGLKSTGPGIKVLCIAIPLIVLWSRQPGDQGKDYQLLSKKLNCPSSNIFPFIGK